MSDEIKFNIKKPNAKFPELFPLPPAFKVPEKQFPFLPGFGGTPGIEIPPDPTKASEKLERDFNYSFSKWQESFFVPGAYRMRRQATKILSKELAIAVKEFIESCEVLIKPGQKVDTNTLIASAAPPPAPPVSPHYHVPGKTLTVGHGKIKDATISTKETERYIDRNELLPSSKLVRQKFITVTKDVDTKPINESEIAPPSI